MNVGEKPRSFYALKLKQTIEFFLKIALSINCSLIYLSMKTAISPDYSEIYMISAGIVGSKLLPNCVEIYDSPALFCLFVFSVLSPEAAF